MHTVERLPALAGRRFLGIFGECARRRRGLRFAGSLDQLSAGLRAIGSPVCYEPLENGIPGPGALGAFRTWGSPWTDVQEAVRDTWLTASVARNLSSVVTHQVLAYDYAFDSRCFSHQLFAEGHCVEDWRLDRAAAGEAEHYLDERYRVLKMRDWGVDLEDLQALRLPFAPAVLMEAYFLRLDGVLSKVWGV
jgi:hypothetical protein